MIHTKLALPENPEIEVMHIGPDQLPYICVCEPLEFRVDSTISWHWHTYFEVAYVAEGSLECRTPDHTVELQKGEAVFINSSVLHMYRKTSVGPCVIYAHIFDSRFLRTAFIFYGKPGGYSEKIQLYNSHHRGPHSNTAGLTQLDHGVSGFHRNSGFFTADSHGIRNCGVCINRKIDPLGPAFPNRSAGLLHTNNLILRSKFRDHGEVLLNRMAKFAEYIRAVENYSTSPSNRQAFL